MLATSLSQTCLKKVTPSATNPCFSTNSLVLNPSLSPNSYSNLTIFPSEPFGCASRRIVSRWYGVPCCGWGGIKGSRAGAEIVERVEESGIFGLESISN